MLILSISDMTVETRSRLLFNAIDLFVFLVVDSEYLRPALDTVVNRGPRRATLSV